MTGFRLLIRNLIYYRQKNLLLALGISISTAVLTGALIVGDSVSFSLNRIVQYRLGAVTHVVKSADSYFTGSLAGKLDNENEMRACPVLLLKGTGVAGGGQERINDLNIIAVNAGFDFMAGTDNYYSRLKDDQVVLSENAAARLGVSKGDEILLRMARASLVPLNAPFVSDSENTVAARMEIIDVADAASLGNFNLENSQQAPFNAFVSLDRLNELMEMEDRANIFLIHTDPEKEIESINGIIERRWKAEDASLRVKKVKSGEYEISGEGIFIDEPVADALTIPKAFRYPVITYFVNSLSANSNTTPYSFVSTLPGDKLSENEVVINSWLAEDLQAGPGDSLKMRFFVVGPLRELHEKESVFIIKSVVSMEGRYADPELMPVLPGLSDAGNCRDWDTGVPVSLDDIRDKDEVYWEEWKGTPKAFINLEKAKEMWKNRFGIYTAFRYSSEETDLQELEQDVLSRMAPAELGIKTEKILEQAKNAAGSGVDFTQLFAGLSFFLLLAGILLAVLLFLLNLEFRKDQVNILGTMGIPRKMIIRVLFAEGVLMAIPGAALGLLLAVLYNRAVMYALNGIWQDIVRTEMLSVHIRPASLALGFFLGILISSLSILSPLHHYMKKNKGRYKKEEKSFLVNYRERIYKYTGILTALFAAGLIVRQIIAGELHNAPLFFIAGGLLLISGISLFRYYLLHLKAMTIPLIRPSHLSLKNAIRNPSRSMSIIILFMLATFLVLSTGSNRKDLFVNARDHSGGTGGFLFYAESSVPVLHNLNEKEQRLTYGLSDDYSFLQFRKAEGDDASCLNLNRIENPVIISTDPSGLEDRFSFVSHTDIVDEDNPWAVLDEELPGGLIPGIADQTVIKWGMGKKTGDTLFYKSASGDSMKILLAGGIAPSVFQGKLIISNKHFLRNFPESSGTYLFLIEGNYEDSTRILQEVNHGLRDFGMETELAAARLTEFNSVTNTYLSVFIVMGALGLLLGTLGLAIVLFRSILERKNEIALLKAIGLNKQLIEKIVGREYYLLLLFGIGIGFFAAVTAALPSIISPNTGISFTSLLILLGILLLSGWVCIRLMTKKALQNEEIYTSLRSE